MDRISPQHLYRLRNEVPLHELIRHTLDIPVTFREGFYRFQCPRCLEMNTAINPTTNLARCFACRVNYNTIDIVILVKNCTFRHAVAILDDYLTP